MLHKSSLLNDLVEKWREDDDCSALEYAERLRCADELTAALSPAELGGVEAVEMSPEFTDTARSALLWVLWHHQGASSPVGQPLRFALGMGRFDELTDWHIRQAKQWAAFANAPTPRTAEAVTDEVRELIDRRSAQSIPGSQKGILRRVRMTAKERESARASAGEGGRVLVIGATRHYGGDDWFRELTVDGVQFLAPLDDDEKARQILGRTLEYRRTAAPQPAQAGASGGGGELMRGLTRAVELLRQIHDEHSAPDGVGVHWGTWEALSNYIAEADDNGVAYLNAIDEGPDGEDGPWAEGWEERSRPVADPFTTPASPATGDGYREALDAIDAAHELSGSLAERITALIRQRDELRDRLTPQPAAAQGGEWMPIESAPSDGLVLLAVQACENPSERRTYAAEQSHGADGLHWVITTGWTGWTRLHGAWEPIGWKPLPQPQDHIADADKMVTPPAHGDGEGLVVGWGVFPPPELGGGFSMQRSYGPDCRELAEDDASSLSPRGVVKPLYTRPTPEAQPPHVGEVIAEMRQEQDRAHLGRFGHRVRDWADRLSTHPTPEAQEARDG